MGALRRLCGPHARARICRAGLLAIVMGLSGTIALAQAPATEMSNDSTEETEAPPAIQLGQVPDRAVGTQAVLDALMPSAAFGETLEQFESELEDALQEIIPHAAISRETLATEPNVRALQGIESELKEDLKRLQPLNKQLEKQLDRLRSGLQKVEAIDSEWEAVAEVARQQKASPTTRARIAGVRREIAKARAAILERRNQILSVADRLVDPTTEVSATLEQIQHAIQERLEGIFRVDRVPIWDPQVRESLREECQAGVLEHLLDRLREAAHYLAEQRRVVAFQIVLFVVLLLGLRSIRARAEAQAVEDYSLRGAKEVFAFPWAMALLIALLATSSLHPLAPRGGAFFAGELIAVAALCIGLRFLVPAVAPLAWGLVIVFMLDRIRDLMDRTPEIERILFLAEMFGALGLLVWLLRSSRVSQIPLKLRRAPFLRLLGTTMRLASVALVFAILANLAGWGDLASLVGNGTLRGGYMGFFIFVLLMVSRGLATFGLILWPLRLLRSISSHRLLFRRRLERVLTGMAILLWLALMLSYLGLLRTATDAVRAMLGAGFSVGAIAISLGDVIAFSVTLWLSFLLARLVNFVLREDVFTRVEAGRGVPYAIAGLIRYTLIFLGFLVGLAAAGVELSKLTVVAGGLGVGIGFGLQNVVNNFVSGLILLFERPIQVGDAVQLVDVWGFVKRIGIRASVIRTFEGAEVIVPNGMLISEKVTNWTLSDKRRRIDLPVGVAYGTPAQKVIDLLVAVAEANPKVIAEPSPRAFFLNFGDSALEFELRAWIGSFDDGYSAKSELAVAVQAALAEAEISIPFPQRDLHLVSVSRNAATHLAAATGPPSGHPASEARDDE